MKGQVHDESFWTAVLERCSLFANEQVRLCRDRQGYYTFAVGPQDLLLPCFIPYLVTLSSPSETNTDVRDDTQYAIRNIDNICRYPMVCSKNDHQYVNPSQFESCTSATILRRDGWIDREFHC